MKAIFVIGERLKDFASVGFMGLSKTLLQYICDYWTIDQINMQFSELEDYRSQEFAANHRPQNIMRCSLENMRLTFQIVNKYQMNKLA